MMPNYANEHLLTLAYAQKLLRSTAWVLTTVLFSEFMCPCTLICVLWTCVLCDVSAYRRKIKTKFEIFLKTKSSDPLWTSYPLSSWCHLDICDYSVTSIRSQACSEAGHSVSGIGRDLHQLVWGWHPFSTFSLALVPVSSHLLIFLHLYLLSKFTPAVFFLIIWVFISPLVSFFALPIPMDTNLAYSTEVCWVQFLNSILPPVS